MPPSLLLLFNHTITYAQEADARESLGIGRIVAPSEEIIRLWATVPPEIDGLADYLAPVRQWLASQGQVGDLVLVQGEFGATFLMINEARRLGLVPVYSTTSRQAVEEHLADGSVQIYHTFAHVRFRHYGK